ERADPRERLLDALELADSEPELLAQRGVRGSDARDQLGATGAGRRKRDAAPGREAFHQHPPALAAPGRLADDRVERDLDAVALGRAVVERHAERVVPAPEHDALGRRRDQGARDAEVLALAEQVLRVAQLEREPE